METLIILIVFNGMDTLSIRNRKCQDYVYVKGDDQSTMLQK